MSTDGLRLHGLICLPFSPRVRGLFFLLSHNPASAEEKTGIITMNRTGEEVAKTKTKQRKKKTKGYHGRVHPP